ncbi:MAG: dTDP-4-dehydrorhamnose reductase [Bacteroidales bacterium]|nr:dTDP-4-dehydrorhamnose reductase [Bacteroidales bacterium]
MRILITGAGGQLGRALQDAAVVAEHDCIFTDVVSGDNVSVLDVTDSVSVQNFIKDNDVQAIVNCAGYTDVERAENDADKSALINTYAPSVLAKAAKENDLLMVHISTDYVFDGKKNTPYSENDAPSPLNVYATTKLEGERAVISSGCRYVILRTAWLYSCYGRNFFKTIVERTAEYPSMKVVVDQVGTPTYAPDLASAILNILGTDLSGKGGIYNYTGEGVCSWYDFAVAIRDAVGHICNIEPCLSCDYPSKAVRPHYSVLDKSKVKETFGLTVPHWTESLRMCIMDYDNMNQ